MSQVLKSGRSIDQFSMDSLREFLKVVLNDKFQKKNPGGSRKANPAGTASAKARKAMTLMCQSAAAKAGVNFVVTAKVTLSPATSSRRMMRGTAPSLRTKRAERRIRTPSKGRLR